MTKVIRHFSQTKPIAAAAKTKSELSDDVLDAVSINFICIFSPFFFFDEILNVGNQSCLIEGFPLCPLQVFGGS